MPEVVWFSGVCDSMLRKVEGWLRAWPRGDVYATRSGWSIKEGNFDVVTGRLLRIPFTKAELEHLVRILDEMKPNWTFTAYLKAKLAKFESFRLLTGNQRLVPLESGDEPLKQALDLLVAAKTGRASLSSEIEKALKEQKDGPLWG